MGSASRLDRARWAILNAPRELRFYALVSLGAYFYQELVPGDPRFSTTGVFVGWVLVTTILILLLIRRVWLAWFMSLVQNLLFLFVLVASGGWPWTLKYTGLVVLTAAAAALLATPAVRRHMQGKRA
jgi:hypothetical protein